ncbi:MAG: hypothetical protein WCK47_15280 [bacterium]
MCARINLLLAFVGLSSANGLTVLSQPTHKTPLFRIGAALAELPLFILYYVSFFLLAVLGAPVSGWALLPHMLCNVGLFLLTLKHVRERRPPIYWGQFDAVVIVFFAYLAVNIYYSEAPGTAWSMTAVYIDSLSAYFFGRILFYRRLRAYVAGLVAALALAWGALYLARAGFLNRPGIRLEFLPLARADQMMELLRLMTAFWVISLPFLMLRRPSNLIFLCYGIIVFGLFGFLAAGKCAALYTQLRQPTGVETNHAAFLTTETILTISRHYPVTGTGLGTFPFLFEAFRRSPSLTTPYLLSAYFVLLVETGIAGIILLFYLLARFPLYIMRRWGLFPNRPLRMAVFIFAAHAGLCFLSGIFDAQFASPAAWFLLWGNYGTLVGLVMVRDPMRIFEGSAARQAEGVADSDQEPAARSAQPPRPIGPGDYALLSVVLIGVIVLTALQAAPVIAARMARKAPNEDARSAVYGARLETAVKIFPLSSELWTKLANYLQQQAVNPAEVYAGMPRIEKAYRRAIALNPHIPSNYEQLAFLYTDTNNTARALETLREGVRSNPNQLVLRLLLVRELERAGSLALATYHVRQALFRISPGQGELYLRLAELYEQRGMRPQAVRYYQYARQVIRADSPSEARFRRLRDKLRIPEIG